MVLAWRQATEIIDKVGLEAGEVELVEGSIVPPWLVTIKLKLVGGKVIASWHPW